MHYLGIEITQANLRAVVIDDDTHSIAPALCYPITSNQPAYIQQQITEATHAYCHTSGLHIQGACITVANMQQEDLQSWPMDVLRTQLPEIPITYAIHDECALVGAHEARHGLFLSADTASRAFAITQAGRSLNVGGWGYSYHDDGSGYWIGQRALRLVIEDQPIKTGSDQARLAQQLLAALALSELKQAIPWAYTHDPQRVRAIAQLAPVVLQEAQTGNSHALEIIVHAAHSLNHLVEALIPALGVVHPKIAFGGELLRSHNLLSEKLCKLLQLSKHPHPKYPPVIGAALIARENTREAHFLPPLI